MLDFVIRYWLQIFFGAICSLILVIIKKIAFYKKTIMMMEDGIKALLRTKIIETYNTVMNNNGITLAQKENLYLLFDEYKKLGGNGLIDDLVRDIEKLPVIKLCDKEA